MQELTLADCYGYAGLSPDAANIALRIEPFKTISANLTRAQVLDAVRAYFGLQMISDPEWLSGPISTADESFSMVTNEREIAIIAMALIAHEVREEGSQFAALAFLVANAFGNRNPKVYPQFVEIVEAAAKDLMTRERSTLESKQIRTRGLSNKLAGSEEDLVPLNDWEALNRILKEVNTDSHDMVKDLAQQLNSKITPLRSEVASLREETDILWWLIGGESRLVEAPYFEMKEGRAAFLIGADLADLSRTNLGPRASVFLINKALREGRSDRASKFKLDALPKFFALEELADVSKQGTIGQVRDLCSLNNAIARASDVGSMTAWRKKYAEDGSLSDKASFDPGQLAVQSFREALLLNALSS